MELYTKSAAELSRMLRDKSCSATEIAQSVFSRIDAVEDKVKAYITPDPGFRYGPGQKRWTSCWPKGRACPWRGHPRGGEGQHLQLSDILTTCASKMLYNFVPPYNATQ